jgi:hypothetical protein
MALTSGLPVLSREQHHKWPPEFTTPDYKRFICGCHRGYDRAQNTIFRLLCEINKATDLSDNEKSYQMLLLRKIIDSIVFTILRQELHVLKRLMLHSSPPSINFEDIARVLYIVNQMNEESRMTFAIVADLSTCVHLCDIVRIDHRDQAKVELIEVKSGKCNAILSAFLDQFEVKIETLSTLKQCRTIPKRMQKQAERMMRQRVRLAQAIQVIENDEGIDPLLQVPIRVSQRTFEVDEFDDLLDEACGQAIKNDVACGVVNDCIHVCVASGETRSEAYRKALKIVQFCVVEHRRKRSTVKDMDLHIAKYITLQEAFRLVNPISANLHTCACRPLLLWRIQKPYLMKVLSGELAILFLLDIAGFLWTVKDLGFEISFSSRRETDELTKQYGKENVAIWGGRFIKINDGRGEQILMSGTFARFIVNLQCPRGILLAYKEDDKCGSKTNPTILTNS